jgi:hypothetical protein
MPRPVVAPYLRSAARSKHARAVRVFLAIGTMLATMAWGAPPTAAEFHAALAGRWQGTLEYKDYQRPDRRVTLPTIIEATPLTSGGVALHIIYDDGPGKTVVDDDRFVLANDRATLAWSGVQAAEQAVYAVRSFTRNAASSAFTLVAERDGMDDDAPATLRETIVLSATSIEILKEVRPRGGQFGFRHVYRLRKP